MFEPILTLPVYAWRCQCLIRLFKVSVPIYRFLFKRGVKPWSRTPEDLRELPSETFGGALARFWAAQGLRPIPCFEDHDALHVLLDFPAEVPGECAMQFYLLGNGKRSAYTLGVVCLSLLILPEYWSQFRKAFQEGSSHTAVWNWPFQDLLDSDLQILRRQIGPCRTSLPWFSYSPMVPLWPLAVLSLFCVGLAGVRPLFGLQAGDIASFRFLVWNLFLAWVPIFPLMALNRRLSWSAVPLAAALSLLFLPNSFYLFTDMIHFRPGRGWLSHFETLAFFAFSVAGLLLGLYALRWWYLILRLRLGRWAAEGAVAVAGMAAGAGVWLGRLLRWNSWDILWKPVKLVKDFELLLLGETFVPWMMLSTFTGIFILLALKAIGHRLIH